MTPVHMCSYKICNPFPVNLCIICLFYRLKVWNFQEKNLNFLTPLTAILRTLQDPAQIPPPPGSRPRVHTSFLGNHHRDAGHRPGLLSVALGADSLWASFHRLTLSPGGRVPFIQAPAKYLRGAENLLKDLKAVVQLLSHTVNFFSNTAATLSPPKFSLCKIQTI